MHVGFFSFYKVYTKKHTSLHAHIVKNNVLQLLKCMKVYKEIIQNYSYLNIYVKVFI